MMVLVGWFNAITTRLFDLIYWPFLGLDPVWAVIAISFLTGLLMLWIFGKTSNQAAIRNVKDKIRGNLIAVRLYQHDIGVVLRAQARIFRNTLTYMKYSLIPMVVIIVPVLIIIIQLNLRFSVRPLAVNEAAVVDVKVRDSAVLSMANLTAPEGVRVETPAVRIPSKGEASWRIRPELPGFYTLKIKAGDTAAEKELVVGPDWGNVSSLRTGESLGQLLLYPGEPPIPSSSPIQSIYVNYPPLVISVLGWNIHWLVLFFVLSVVFGFAFKGIFGVEV